MDNTLLDLQNSSYPTQPHSIIAKYVPPKSVCVHRLTKITSYEISFRSQHAELDKWKQIARRHQLCYF